VFSKGTGATDARRRDARRRDAPQQFAPQQFAPQQFAPQQLIDSKLIDRAAERGPVKSTRFDPGDLFVLPVFFFFFPSIHDPRYRNMKYFTLYLNL